MPCCVYILYVCACAPLPTAAFDEAYPLECESEDFHLRDPRHVIGGAPIRVTAALFPLIAAVIPKWLGVLRRQGADKPSTEKRLYLVSGAGLPRNPTHNPLGNSTEAVANIIEVFIRAAYPDIVVEQLPSSVGVYRCVTVAVCVCDCVCGCVGLWGNVGDLYDSMLILTTSSCV